MRIIRVPLKAEKWQVDILHRRMNLCSSIYNRLADEYERTYHRMTQDIEYIVARNTIDEAYNGQDDKLEAAKKKPAYRAAVRAQSKMYKKYGFSSYHFVDRAIEVAGDYKEILPTRVAHYTIGLPLWDSFHNYLIGRSSSLKRKATGSQQSVISDGRSGIRLIDDTGKARRGGVDVDQPLFVVYGRGKGKRALKLPVRIDPRNDYMRRYLACPMRWISITRCVDRKGRDSVVALILIDDSAVSEQKDDNTSV